MKNFEIPTVKLLYDDPVEFNDKSHVVSRGDAIEIFKTTLKDCMQHHEELHILLLNSALRLLGVYKHSVGGELTTSFEPKFIMQAIILSNAYAVIVGHNHPSGNIKPSEVDKTATRQLVSICKTFNIKFIDHFILSANSFYSFDENCLL